MADFGDHILFLLFLLASIFFLLRVILKKFGIKRRLPPSPIALPVIGHLYFLTKLPHQAFHTISSRYGHFVFLWFGSKSCLLVSSPEMASQCLKNQRNLLPKPNQKNKFGLHHLRFFRFCNATLWTLLEVHEKGCMTELLGGRMLHQHLPIKVEETRLFLNSMMQKAGLREEVNIGKELAMRQIT